MLAIPLDLINEIINKYDILGLNDKIRLISTCRTFYQYIFIEHLQSSNIKNDILNNTKFKNLIFLDLSDNRHVTNISHLRLLKDLRITGSQCFLTNINILTGIINLDISSKPWIINIYNLINLVKLDIRFTKIPQNEIMNLTNLKSLYISNNRHINNINHLINLTYLSICYNQYINCLSHLTKLTCLNMIGATKITTIENLYSLTNLEIDNTRIILSPLTNLQYLNNIKL